MLLSAVLVALVGILMKKSDDKLVFRALLSITSAILVFPLVFLVPLPPTSAWKYLGLGALAHFFYQICYVGAFERGDMSLVYPIMRGIAPAITALFAFVFLSETLSNSEIAGLLIVVGALIGFSWQVKSTQSLHFIAVLIAMTCGVFIALYSVIDAAGMRISRSILDQAWTYIVWFFLLDMIGMTVLVLFRRGRTGFKLDKEKYIAAFVAGAVSLMSFSFALYAFTLAPVAKMSAMRETSVIFGAIFAVIFLKEEFGSRRIFLSGVMVIGLFLLQK